MKKLFGVLCVAVLVTAGLLTDDAAADLMPVTDVIAVTGAQPPDMNGTFSTFGTPYINDAGQIAFTAMLSGTSGGGDDDRGIFLGAPGSSLFQIARRGDAAADGNGFYSTFTAPILNNAGQVLFHSRLSGTSGGTDDFTGLFRGDPFSPTTQIARRGAAAPDGNGSFFAMSFIQMNNAGQVSFNASFSGTAGGEDDNSGLYLADGSTDPQRIVRKGEAAPDGNGVFSGIRQSRLNASGQVSFIAGFSGTTGGMGDDVGVYRGGVMSTPVRIVRKGEAAPDANGVFSTFSLPSINDVGQVAFTAMMIGSSGGIVDHEGIFRGDGTSGPIQMARGGQAAPDGNGVFSEFTKFPNPSINNAGQVAFTASLSGTSGGSLDNHGIFLFDDVLGLLTVVRGGQETPEANGNFGTFNSPMLNEQGQVAFFTSLVGTSGGEDDNKGIYFFDADQGILKVAREGDAMLGSTIQELSFNQTAGLQINEMREAGLNNFGQVAYQFTLADGREGVAVWSAPEPSTMLLLAAGVSLMLCRKRRSS